MQIGELVTKFTADLTDLKAGIAQYGRELDAAEKENKDFNTGLAAIATTVSGVVAGFTVAVLIIREFILKATGFAAAITDASYATGLSVEELGRWKAAGFQVGVTLDDITMASRMMTSRMGEVSDPASKMSKDLASIGVSAYDANGNLKDTNTMLWDVINALNKMPPGMERNSIALDIMGRGWYRLAPMINEATDAQNAYNTAAPFSEEKIKELHEYQIALDKAGGSMERWGVIIGDKLSPLIDHIFIPIIDHLTGNINFLSDVWDTTQFKIASGYLYLEGLVSKNMDKYNAFVTAGIPGNYSTTPGAPHPSPPQPDIKAQEAAAADAMKLVTDAVKDQTKALKDLNDEKQRLADIDKNYIREMSLVGWDVARARELTIRHGWAVEDQTGKIGQAQVAAGQAVAKTMGTMLSIGTLNLNIQGYNKTLGQAVSEAGDLAKQRIVAGIPS